MSTEVLALVVVIGLLVLLSIGIPVAFALMISGGFGLAALRDWGVAGSTLASAAFSSVARFSLIVIPLFVMLGYFVNQSGLGQQLFAVLATRTRRLPGGLALASIFACAGFGAVSGASMTGVATVGPVAVPEMRRHGYSDELSTGVIAAAGTLGILIPPSIAIVLYGIVTRESIEKMLLAGIIPGVLSALVYAVLVVVLVRFRSIGGAFGIRVDEVTEARVTSSSEIVIAAADASLAIDDVTGVPLASAPSASRSDSGSPRDPGQAGPLEFDPTVSWVWPVAKIGVLFFVIIGGIYLGVATVTESAAVGAFIAMIFLVWSASRSGGLRGVWNAIVQAVSASISATSMLFLLLIGGAVFGTFLLLSGIPQVFARWVTALPLPPTVIVILILLGFVVLGTILDGFSTMLIAVPLTHPVVTSELGFDPIVFAILVIKSIEIGLVTPPVGINAYVISGITRTPVERVFRGLIPFYIADVATIALLFAFPVVVTFIPDLMSV
jgi:C4-dicarboxylate transporter, DctM subunit